MTITWTRTTIAALAALAALVLPASALANPLSPTEWRYNVVQSATFESVGQPLPGHLYDLNEAYQPYGNQGSSLVFGLTRTGCAMSQPGSELQWNWPGQLQWEFRRQARHPMTNAITGTERVALYNHLHGAYLVREGPKVGHANQRRRINLRFSNGPSYEWQVADGHGDWAVLYNTSEQAYLIREYPLTFTPYCGIDLTWQQAPFSLPNGYQEPPNQIHPPTPERMRG